MKTAIYCIDLDSMLDKKHLKECLEEAILQVNSSRSEVVFSFGTVEVHIDYENNELFIMV